MEKLLLKILENLEDNKTQEILYIKNNIVYPGFKNMSKKRKQKEKYIKKKTKLKILRVRKKQNIIAKNKLLTKLDVKMTPRGDDLLKIKKFMNSYNHNFTFNEDDIGEYIIEKYDLDEDESIKKFTSVLNCPTHNLVFWARFLLKHNINPKF